MCWSIEASTVLATAGIGTTVYAACKKEHPALWLTLGYFSLMEALQAFTYLVIDDCASPGNQIATLLGYLHLCFQPFFGNVMALYFVPARVRERVQIWAYMACFAGAVLMLIQMYPFAWAGHCSSGIPSGQARALCGESLCSVSGNWHIAWLIPLNGIADWSAWYAHGMVFYAYLVPMFVLPALYGSWRLVLYHIVMGPWLAMMLTDNWNEWPAVWCLLSIGFLLIVVKTPLRQWLFVKSWPLWGKNAYD